MPSPLSLAGDMTGSNPSSSANATSGPATGSSNASGSGLTYNAASGISTGVVIAIAVAAVLALWLLKKGKG